MKRLSVGHLESTGYDMMFGDANKTKEFKKLDEINGVKVKGRGYIANNGDLAGEFFSPYVPLDQGFSSMMPTQKSLLWNMMAKNLKFLEKSDLSQKRLNQ